MFSNDKLVCQVSQQTWFMVCVSIHSHTIPEAQNQQSWIFIHSTNINWMPGNLLIHELKGGKILFRSYTRPGSYCYWTRVP